MPLDKFLKNVTNRRLVGINMPITNNLNGINSKNHHFGKCEIGTKSASKCV